LKNTLSKGFWMMKLLNRSYPAPVRAIGAVLAFWLGFLATGRFTLAKELGSRCWHLHDYKLVARRLVWYIRKGWLGLEIIADPFFDPTEGMNDFQLAKLENFALSRKSKLDPIIFASAIATIAARRLNNNANPKHRSVNVDAFEKACNDLLLHKVKRPTLEVGAPVMPRVGDFPIENAKKTLSDFQDLFPTDQMRWFVISGTFLGLIREKGFLAHDYDIDLGVFEDEVDIQTTIDKIAESPSFVLKKYDYHQSNLFGATTLAVNPDVPYLLKLVHASGIHIDLFIHYRDTNHSPAVDWHGSSLHRWENSPFELVSYPFYGLTVFGPADADRYLTENYGDWGTPVTNFSCTTDTPNLVLVPHPIAIATFLCRYVLSRQTDPDQAAKLETELLSNGFLRRGTDDTFTFSGELFASVV
jgi:phosphorylcholine metabolism protein LicD